ncbi:ABC transporter ATP-binding protein [Phytoactinopolyspora endophytica]|uniref:ABC transporter ATP-binding protein n=1 Tax=Phytoactinopolyspora endophytica TaxID=1642495 RepID=UPI00101D596C|nr:ABC transporter ATP-binding protein [Phytoactinopolyspora endophytica]
MLAVKNLDVVYEDVVLVLKNVTLQVPAGAIVALLGANGAGKTTVLRAITGLLDVHRGSITRGGITLDDEPLHHLDAPGTVAAGVGQVMEGRRIFTELTVEENLRIGGHAADRRSVAVGLERAYTLFPVLAERRRQVAGYLSGGEQQMLAIGRALMSRPRYLLLDEPSLGLAPRLVQHIKDLIVEINRQGTGVLLVEQNASMALSIASHGYVMETGKVVMDAPAEVLRANDDIREFYLGLSEERAVSFRDVKHYRRRKRWLS